MAEAPLPGGSILGAPVTEARARTGLARLEAAGSAIELPDGRWCARHLLVRLHAASRSRRRHRVEPVSLSDFVRFLACWQHVAAGTQAEGRSGLLAVIEQLQGLEVAAGEWERHVLPARVAGYDPRWLDELCLAGEVAWARLTPRPERGTSGPDGIPVRGRPRSSTACDRPRVAGARRRRRRPRHWPSWPVRTWPGCCPRCGPTGLRSSRPPGPRPTSWPRSDAGVPASAPSWRTAAGRLDAEVDEGLWDLVARGIVTADAFSAVRSLLSARHRQRSGAGRGAARRAALGRQRSSVGTRGRRGSLVAPPGGRWHRHRPSEPARRPRSWPRPWPGSSWPGGASSPGSSGPTSPTASRGGTSCGPCAGSRPAAQTLGGRFVAGISGEQYASPEAVALLGQVRGDPGRGDEVVVAGADPLNLTGAWLGGTRVPAVRHRRVHYQDGVPADLVGPAPSSR